jgi:outer membrane protein assembly factor BamC
METGWLDSPGNPGQRDKFRLSIEPGVHVGSSEIAMVHIRREDTALDTELIVWPRLSESEDREFFLLQEISQYLADRTDIYSSSSASLLAGSLETETKAMLTEEGQSGAALELRISVNRAWGQVAQALGDAGLTITDRDRDALFFQVEFTGFTEEENSRGFFSRVFNRDAGDAEILNRYQVSLLETSDLVRVTAEPMDSESLAGLESDLLQAILSNL